MKVKDMFFCFSSFFPFLRASDGHLNISFILLYHHKQVLVVFFFFTPSLCLYDYTMAAMIYRRIFYNEIHLGFAVYVNKFLVMTSLRSKALLIAYFYYMNFLWFSNQECHPLASVYAHVTLMISQFQSHLLVIPSHLENAFLFAPRN